MTKRLLIIDGYSLLFRCFYALPPLQTSYGVPVGAVYGVTKILANLLNNHKQCSVVVALDSGSKTFRQDIYSGYKTNRKDPPHELIVQFNIFDEAIKAFGINSHRIEGYEADDIIASYVELCKKNDFSATIVSSDKDLMQLISDTVQYYDPAKKKNITSDDVMAKFGVMPNDLATYLSLVGDSVDNVPGVKSIGAKTAQKLTNQYQTIDGIYQNLDKIDSIKIKQALIKGKEDAILSWKLICLNNQIENLLSLSQLWFDEIDGITLRSFAEKYTLRTLVNQLKKPDQESSVESYQKNQENPKNNSNNNQSSSPDSLDKQSCFDLE